MMILVLVLLLAACSHDSNQSSDKDSASTKNDDNKTKYHRIVSLMPSNTEILYRLGLGKNIVGVSTVDDYPKDVKKAKQFDAMNLNKEKLLKAKPDLILAHESQKHSSGKVLNSLKKDGVKVVYVKDAQSINETYDTFKSIGKLTGREKQAKDLVDETKIMLIKSLILFQIIIKSKVYLWRYHLNQIFILQVRVQFSMIC